MYETKNKIRQTDLEELANDGIFENFKNQTILVTGATGLIGSEIVLGLLCANRIKNLNINVVASVRNLDKAKEIFCCVLDNSHFKIVCHDINDVLSYDLEVDYIIHAAGTTASNDIISKPVETAQTTINGTLNILGFAHQKKVKSFVYLSSIEIYGQTDYEKEDIKEYDLGTLDPMKVRNVYSLSKKLAENICVSFSQEYGLNTKIARLTQTFGAGISKEENRVFAQFSRSIIEKKDIILHTQGSSYKNYCYLTDAVSAIFTILLRGENAQAYNVANYNTGISIKDMALMLCEKYKTSKIQILVEDKNRGYNSDVVLKLNTDKLEALGWRARVGLEEMFERLIASLKL